MRTILAFLAVATALSLTSGCSTRVNMTKEEFAQVYVGSPLIKETIEGVLQKAEVVHLKVETSDALGAGLTANSGGLLKGAGAILSAASLLGNPPGNETYILHLTDKDGNTIKTKPYGPFSPRKFAVGHKYRVMEFKDGRVGFYDLTSYPSLEKATNPREVATTNSQGADRDAKSDISVK